MSDLMGCTASAENTINCETNFTSDWFSGNIPTWNNYKRQFGINR